MLPAGERCTFNRSPETDPVFCIAREGGTAAMKLNGNLVALEPAGDTESAGIEFSAPGPPSQCDGSATKPTGGRTLIWFLNSMSD